MLYNPPTGGGSNDSYVGKNLGAGQQGSKVPPMSIEGPQREIVAAIVAAGLAPSNSDLTQLSQAIKKIATGRVGRGITVALSSVQSIPTGVETAVTWTPPIFDTDNVWNSAFPSRIYIPTGTKKIRVCSEACFEANSTGSRKSRILMNGVDEGYGLGADRRLAAGAADVTILTTAGAPIDITNGVFGALAANGTNYLQLMLTQDSGGALNVRLANTWLAVEFFD